MCSVVATFSSLSGGRNSQHFLGGRGRPKYIQIMEGSRHFLACAGGCRALCVQPGLRLRDCAPTVFCRKMWHGAVLGFSMSTTQGPGVQGAHEYYIVDAFGGPDPD